ncbi:hypothetical protein OHC33_010450 [Knufia fluminis]|uniref:Uncharacterized protein n=1 Tax=Knufia fluminis TaxID=191047 RepID=A0AAN8E837_9EURO|nr:hypothetical protein OHC33_010450 [Knufia fluminis]
MAPRSPPWESKYSHIASASYLAELRSNRPARPTGSRPLPSRPLPTPDENVPPRAGSALSFRSSNEQLPENKNLLREQKLSHRASLPASSSFGSLGSQRGRPLVPTPGNTTTPSTQRRVSPPTATLPDAAYQESSARVKEREEAHALREALQKIDKKDDEMRIHDAAKMEAADLVWKHRNPQLAEVEKTSAYPNPDLEKDKPKYGELGHAKKPSQSIGIDTKTNSRSASGDSTASTDSKRHRLPWLRRRPKPEPAVSAPTPAPAPAPAPPSTTAILAVPVVESPVAVVEQENILQKGARKTSGKRHVSSGSSKGVFRNPEDEIYEEAEEMPTIIEAASKQQLPLRSRESNSLPRGSRPQPEKSFTDPLPSMLRTNRVEIWKNQPTQSRNAAYTASRALPQTPIKEVEADNSDSPSYKDGIEIRSDDIRAATSMRKSDRSPNLPTPTAVSDRPGRPIVSFDPKWKRETESPRNSRDLERPQENKNDGSMSYPVKPSLPVPEITIMEDPRSPALQKEKEIASLQQEQSHHINTVPSINISGDEPARPSNSSRPLPQINLPEDSGPNPPVPTINIEPDVPQQSRPLPQINLPEAPQPTPSIPAINIEPEPPKSRPLPTINVPNGKSRPLPSHTQSSPSKLPQSRPTKSEMSSRVPWLSRNPTSASTSSVTCTACSLPISGRIVTASGASSKTQKARFHPECFSCHHCSTGLECVSFYPEPEIARLERLQTAMPHLDPEDPQITEIAKSNEDLHFFCHLDYHELFSPRCHNCKTPIEGAVILALGRHYHADHFFCAECGDPFTSESPFVEHNNYPYCVSCHTKRTSSRCRACKAPILNEMTIEALGGKWHDSCFVCCECGGDFGEEGRFFVREIEVELTEKEKRKGYGPKVEEKAACQGCEERRVKNVNIFL